MEKPVKMTENMQVAKELSKAKKRKQEKILLNTKENWKNCMFYMKLKKRYCNIQR